MITHAVSILKRVLMIRRFTVFRPGNGSPSATNAALLGVGVVSPKALLFQNRSSSKFAYTLLTIFCRIAPRRIFKLSPNQVIIINF